MLDYLYGKPYKTPYTYHIQPWNLPLEIGYTESPSDHVEIFILGDKYDIDSLKTEAAEWYQDYVKWHLEGSFLSDEVVYAIQKVVGPDAFEHGTQTLVKFVEEMVFKYDTYLLSDDTFRELLAKGRMLRGDLALEFLTEISNKCDNE